MIWKWNKAQACSPWVQGERKPGTRDKVLYPIRFYKNRLTALSMRLSDEKWLERRMDTAVSRVYYG
jgi:hypothetical protein